MKSPSLVDIRMPCPLTRVSKAATAIMFCFTISGAFAGDPADSQDAPMTGPETMLIKSLQEITENRMASALSGIEELLQATPNFRLAHLIKGDLLLARTRPIDNMGAMAGAAQQLIEDLREEARARIQWHQSSVPQDMTPKYLLQMQPEQKYAVIADTRKSRLYLYRNVKGQPHYLADYYISSGKNGPQKLKEGDKKTPVGVYFVTADVPREKLTDFYGGKAFPINYPNEWDKREGRSGFGIWLHGTPSNTYSRPPRASDGCVVLSNGDLNSLATRLQVGITPVIISEQIEWIKPKDATALRKQLLRRVEHWRRTWESGNIDAYIANYGREFSSENQNLAEWAEHKRQINATKRWIKVEISNVDLFLYPGRDDLAVVNFDQEYSSSNLSNKIRKRQYWMRENGSGPWKIIHESAA